MFELKIANADAVIKAVNKKGYEAKQKITEANIKVANYMTTEVKQSISGHRDEHRSVDTGNMMRSVVGAGNADGAIIMGGAEYTIFMEEGMTLRNGKHWEGRHHFRNSLERNKSKINAFYAEKLKNL
jgi:hypothetical protein